MGLIKYVILTTLKSNPKLFHSKRDIVSVVEDEAVWLDLSMRQRVGWSSCLVPCAIQDRNYYALITRSTRRRERFDVIVYQQVGYEKEQRKSALRARVPEMDYDNTAMIALADQNVQEVLYFLDDIGARRLRGEVHELVRDGRLFMVRGESLIEANGSIKIGELWEDRARAIIHGALIKSGLPLSLNTKFERLFLEHRDSPDFDPDLHLGLKSLAPRLGFVNLDLERTGGYGQEFGSMKRVFGISDRSLFSDVTKLNPIRISDDDVAVAKVKVDMRRIHGGRVSSSAAPEEDRKIWYVISGSLIPYAQRSLVTRLNKRYRYSRTNEKILILGEDQNQFEEIEELLKDPDAEVYAALDKDEDVIALPARVEALLFRGERGDFRQLEGIVKALKALKKRDSNALMNLYELLTGNSYIGKLPFVDAPGGAKEVMVFLLQPIRIISYGELSRLNETLLGLLLSP